MTVVRVAAVAAVACAGSRAVLARRPPGGDERWRRDNYRHQRPSLVGGPAVVLGVAAGLSLTAPGPAALALSCGALGLYDDLAGDSHARGLRGHLAALRQRRVTTGMVKLAGLVTSGATLAATEHRCPRHALTDAALVAGTGNLLNLFDLRPGRALKVALGVGVPLAALGEGAGALAAAAVTGSAAALVPHDLREQVMIGDCGANALGAVLGWALAQALPPRGRAAALAAVVGLTLASERVSFSRVIESSPTLSSLDSWGRRQ